MNTPRGMVNSSLDGGMPTGMNSPRGMVNSTLTGDDKARQGALAQQARASENKSMTDLSRERALGTISAGEGGVKNPYGSLSGGRVTADLASMTVRDAVALSKTSWSGKIANVIGAYGFKDKTLADVAAKMGLLDAKMTPAVQDQLAVGLMQARANRATVDGEIDVDKFAQELSKEWASVADPTTGISHYAKNGIDKASISAATAREIAKDLIANGVVAAGRTVGSVTAANVSQVQTQRPGVGRFSSTYLGSTSTSTPQKSAASPQRNDPSGLPAGTYRGYDPSGLPPDAPVKAPAPGARPSDPVSVVSGQAPATPVTGNFPDRPRTLGQKIAAGVIDAGGGMLPGIGMGVSLVNGGLALTGNATLGERIVDSFVTGKGAGTPPAGNSAARDAAGIGNRGQIIKKPSAVPAKAESFEDRYIKFVDPTVRPTPGQRWDYNTPGYA